MVHCSRPARTCVELADHVVEVAEPVEGVLAVHSHQPVVVGVPLGHALGRVLAPVLREILKLWATPTTSHQCIASHCHSALRDREGEREREKSRRTVTISKPA
jgi:hypothetical protein